MSLTTCNIGSTIATPQKIKINESETCLLANASGILEFIESNFGTAKAFTFTYDTTGWTVKAKAKKKNSSGATVHEVGTASGAAANTTISVTIDMSTAIADTGTGEYSFEVWLENDADSTKTKLVYPVYPNGAITLDVIDRVFND